MPFNPKYTVTDKMRNNITKITSAREVIERTCLSPELNVVGTQLADLAAYPVARYIHNPNKPNPAYDIVKTKFYKGKGWIQGLKIFP